MEIEPIDGPTQPGASSKSVPVLDTTNPAPPKICGSSSSHAAPEKEREDLKRLLKQTSATLSPPLGQFFVNMILQIAAFAAAISFGVFAVKSINVARTANEYSASANRYASRALEEARVANQVAMLAICSQSGLGQNSSFAAFCVRVLDGAPMVMPEAASNLFTKISTATTPTATGSSSTSIAPSMSSLKSTLTATAFYSSYSTQEPSRMTPPPVGSSPENKKGKTLAIALPISLIFVAAIIVIISIIRSKACSKARSKVRSEAVVTSHYGLPATIEFADHGAVENLGDDHGDHEAHAYVQEQDEVLEHGYPPKNKPSKQLKGRNLTGDWWKTFRAYFLDSTVSTNQKEHSPNEKVRCLKMSGGEKPPGRNSIGEPYEYSGTAPAVPVKDN